MRFLFVTLQKVESNFYGRVGIELRDRGHEVTHLTYSRRAAYLFRKAGFETHVMPQLVGELPTADAAAEAARMVQRYDTPSLRDIYRTDPVCNERSDEWCVRRTVAQMRAVERLVDRLRPDVIVPEVGNELMRTAAHLVGMDRGIPVLLLGYTIFPRSLMLCRDTLNAPLVAPDEIRQLSEAEDAELDEFVEQFTSRAAPIRPYRSRPVTAGRARTLARHVAVKALADYDNDYLRPLSWSLSLAAERIRPRIARRLYGSPPAKRRYVYFPLHLTEDYKLKRLIPEWSDQEWVIGQVARSLPDGYELVVKEHPIAVGRYGLRFLRRLTRIPNVRLVDPYTSSHDLISGADAVVVISSTVGLEALLYERPVLTLGRPYYSGYGLTLDLQSASEIRNLVPAVLDFRPHPELVRRFLHAGMRRSSPGAPVLVDRSDENAIVVAGSLEQAALQNSFGVGGYRATGGTSNEAGPPRVWNSASSRPAGSA